jgi:aspartate/methionine/tyrosine aminotransferase
MNSDLLDDIEPFYVMEILEEAQKYEKKGIDISHLEIGEPTRKTNKLIKQYANKAISSNYDRYSHSLGIQPLREAIAKKYKKEMGINISEDQVIITTGSSAAIILGLITSIEEGDEVLLVEPYYPCYPQLVKIFGGKIKLFTTHPEENFQINIKNIKKAITKKTKLIIINSPSNPTGVAQTGEVLKSIGELGIKIISDEVYQGLNYEQSPETMLKYKPDSLVVNGFSKFYSMTGWRLGYLIAPKAIIRNAQKLQQNMFICAPTISQHAALGALNIDQEEIQKMKREYIRNKDLLIKELDHIGLNLNYKPDSAFYVLCDMGRICQDSLELSRDILRKVHLGVAPGKDFGPNYNRHIRLSYASSITNLKNGLAKLKKYIYQYT